MRNKYSQPQDIQNKIQDGIVRYKGEFHYSQVREGEIYLSNVNKGEEYRRLKRKDDPDLDISLFELGYLKFSGNFYYMSRSPCRQFRQVMPNFLQVKSIPPMGLSGLHLDREILNKLKNLDDKIYHEKNFSGQILSRHCLIMKDNEGYKIHLYGNFVIFVKSPKDYIFLPEELRDKVLVFIEETKEKEFTPALGPEDRPGAMPEWMSESLRARSRQERNEDEDEDED